MVETDGEIEYAKHVNTEPDLTVHLTYSRS